MPPKKPAPAFTSFRILGKKAQDLLQRAKQNAARAQKNNAKSDDAVLLPESNEPMIVIRFAPVSIAQSALVLSGIVAGVWLLYVLRDDIVLLLLAFFVAAIIDPGVRAMERFRVPRGIAILIHYFIAIFISIFLLVSLIPIIANQLQQIAVLISDQANAFLSDPHISLPLLTVDTNKHLTDLVRATLENLSIKEFTDAMQRVSENMSNFAQGSVVFATHLAGSVITFLFDLIIVLVLAFFIQTEREHIRMWIRGFLPSKSRMYMDSKAEAVHQKIAMWARGQMLLGLCIGVLVFVALEILGIPYAATLSVLAAFTEFIPYIGPLIAAVPAVLIAITQGGFVWALVVIGVYYIIQWCESNLLVPLIMKRAVGLSPIAIIFSMLAGISFPELIHPMVGMLISVPVTTIIAIFLDDWRQQRTARMHE